MSPLYFETYALIISVIFFLVSFACGEIPANCVTIDKQSGRIICICNKNKTSCDWLRYEFPTKSGSGHLITTSKKGERFKVAKLNSKLGKKPETKVTLDLSLRYQRFLGWGTAFTDAAGMNVMSLSTATGSNLLASYFERDGLQLNIGRVPIGGTDFSPRGYTYDDLSDNQTDYNLKNWALAEEDYKYKIPIIEKANNMHKEHSRSNMKLFGSPWTPPAWMKTNHRLQRGHLIDNDRTYSAWAEYQVKFYKEYKKNLGFDMWGGTVQNEPASSDAPTYFFNSLQLSANETAKLVGQYLGPALEREGFTKNKFNLMVGDDNIGLIDKFVPNIMKDEQASKHFSGLAFHWYSSGWLEPYDKLSDCIEKIKDKIDFVLMTEACNGWRKLIDKPVVLGSWERGEHYAVDMFQDVLRMSAGWVDWNFALDMSGGPTYVHNTVDSPIIVNKEKDEFYKQPMYYIRGHFSRFFRPASVRVGVTPSTLGYHEDFMTAAVLDESAGIVAINMLNRYARERTVDINIVNGNKDVLTNSSATVVTLAPHSMNTVVLKL